MDDTSGPELEELQRIFAACDPNGDGRIDCDEFHMLLIKLDGEVSREECELDFLFVDTDEDGYVSFEEFTTWWLG
jgi:Ca2+-binding EF-hand superfamily protein